MSVRNLSFVLTVLLGGVAVAGEAAAGPSRPAGGLILDESCYWRYYVQFGPDLLDAGALKAEGQKLLRASGMKRLETKVRRYWRPPFVRPDQVRDFADADWRDHARVWFAAGQGDSERAGLNSFFPPPPAEWTSPSFRCDWPRQRLPLGVGNLLRPSNMHGDKDMQQLGVRAGCYRTTFELPADADCALALSFRGGARVFVNGTELARSHLPAGPLAPGAHARAYPAEAYLCRQDELAPGQWEREIRKVGLAFCEDLPGKFDDAFADGTSRGGREYWSSRGRSSFAGYFGGWTQINRKGFERITSLRNRTLGPIKIPAKLLRKGANVLAVEVRASPIHPVVLSGKGGDWGRAFQRVMYWSHCRLLGLELRCTSSSASALVRPAGVQVWAEDMHRRCYSADFGPPGAAGAVRFVGAANGTYCGQIVVGTDRELTGLRITPGALKHADGAAEIPAGAIRVGYMRAHPVGELVKLGQIRNTVEDRSDPLCPPAEQALVRFGPVAARAARLPRAERLKIVGQLSYFDHIAGAPPQSVPAGTCQPVWLWLDVPADAAPGVYRGAVEVRAEPAQTVVVPVEAEVLAWRLPAPGRFQTIVALEQSPYGVARQYGVPLWSEAHFKLLAASFRQLARVGSDILFIPCLQNTEFGNFEDTIIRWTRKKDGSLAFDYRALDRYLSLAVEHLGRGSPPQVICFVVMHGVDRFGPGGRLTNTVGVLDEATGKTETLRLDANSPGYRDHWKAFATSLHAHLARRGLGGSMHWGFCWDNVGDPILPALLAELVPEVKWARSGHHGHPVGMFAFACSSLGFSFTETSMQGWKRALPDLLCPRSGSSVLSSNGHSPPFAFRLVSDRALVAGANGIGRIGADYWADIFFRGYRGSLSGGIAGMPCSYVLYPGKDGAEPSARFEALREGAQEAEARVYLEQALDRRLIEGDLARRLERTLFEHNRETLYVSPGRVGVQVHEYAAGWQGRSRRLYAAAAAAAGVIGLDVDRTKIAAQFPARATVPVAVTLRNWTARPRAYRAAADRPWIVLKRAAGTAVGHEPLEVAVDTHMLAPGAKAGGKLTVTDVASGRAYPIEIAAEVGEVFDLVMPAYDILGAPGHASAWNPRRVEDHAVFNVEPGGSDGGEYALVNRSGSRVAWKIASAADWLTVEPAAGGIAPGERTFVRIIARPADKGAITREGVLTVSDGDGAAKLKRRCLAHVIPPYRAPAGLPGGEVVHLKDVPKSRIRLHKSVAYWVGTSLRARPDYGPKFGPNPQVQPGGEDAGPNDMHGAAEQVTVYDVAGAGFAAFSAAVRINPAYRKPTREGHHRVRVSFEVHVDGKVAAQSGLMTPADEPRTLVAGGLAAAREVRLVTRFDRPDATNLRRRVYVQWKQPRFHRSRGGESGG